MRPLSAAIFALVISSCAFGQAYTAITLAGTFGSPGYTGDTGYANAAQLYFPWAVAVDASGNVYIADSYNNVIREVTVSNGAIITLVGNGTPGFSGDGGAAVLATLNDPAGVAVDSVGNVYIADCFNERIRMYSNVGATESAVLTLAGNGTPAYSGDNGPAANSQLFSPEGLAVDSAGNLYIADSQNYRVRKISKGVITTVAGNGTPGYSGDNGPATSAQLRAVYSVAVDSAGNLYIADTDNNAIRKVSNGVITTVVGTGGKSGYTGDNGPAASARLYGPTSVAVDSAGNLYIADLFNNAVRKVSNGVITTIAGSGGGLTGGGPVNGILLNSANGVAVDAYGNVYIADTDNQRILELTPSAPSITSLVPSSAYEFGQPFTLTVNGTGFLAGASVKWNGTALATALVSGTQLTATVPASLLTSLGSATITEVNPGGAASNALSFSVGIPPLVVTASSLPAGTVGTAYLQTLSATGGTPPYHNWVLSSGSLPPGLTLDGNAGTIGGVPASAAGSPYAFTVMVKDSAGAVSTGSFSISISQPAALTITTASPLPAGAVGVPYYQVFMVTGGTAPYTNWGITAGSLPPGTGLILEGQCSLPSATGSCTSMAGASGTPTAAGTFTFTVQAIDSANATATKQFSLTINPAGTASIYAGGIVNSASYAGGGVSPGEVVTIFGSGLGPNTLAGLQVNNGAVSTNLASVQVMFDGFAAPLVYAESDQVAAVVPYEVAGETSTKVQVSYQGQNSNTLTVPVVAAAPGIFTLDYSGMGPGTVLNQDGTVNSPANPAAGGSLIYVYATGEGQTSPGGVDGQLDGSPAPKPVQAVTATIGGVNATVESAGGVTGAVAGIIEVVLQVPTTSASNAAPLLLNIGGATSHAGVTIAIKALVRAGSSERENNQ